MKIEWTERAKSAVLSSYIEGSEEETEERLDTLAAIALFRAEGSLMTYLRKSFVLSAGKRHNLSIEMSMDGEVTFLIDLIESKRLT